MAIFDPNKNSPTELVGFPTITVKSAYSTTVEDYRIVCDSASPFDITLHSPVGTPGDTLVLMNKNVGPVTLTGYTVNGDTNPFINQWESFILFSDGAQWLIQ